jgi:hypothetical protein
MIATFHLSRWTHRRQAFRRPTLPGLMRASTGTETLGQQKSGCWQRTKWLTERRHYLVTCEVSERAQEEIKRQKTRELSPSLFSRSNRGNSRYQIATN